MILVDSSVWIDFLKNKDTPQTELLDRLWVSEQVGLGDLILAEVLRGVPSDRAEQSILRDFARLPVVQIADRETAITSSRYYRHLRSLGRTVRGTIDCLIATRCILSGHALLYSDRDFDSFVQHLGLQSACPA